MSAPTKPTRTTLISLCIIAGGIGVLVIASLLGYFYIGVKSSDQAVALYNKTAVCDSALVQEYTAITNKTSGYGADTLDKIVAKIKQRPRYASEVVCNVILLHQASLKGDVTAAQTLRQHIATLMHQPQPVDALMTLGLSKTKLDSLVEAAKYSTDKTTQGDGAGEG